MADDEEEDKGYKLFVPGQGIRPEKSINFSGYGCATYPPEGEDNPSDTYEGQFIEGYRRGKGVYTFGRNGDKYEGYYEENKKHGFGKMMYTSKSGADEPPPDDDKPSMREGTYLGYFNAGMRGRKNAEDTSESEGTFTYVNGDIYVGQWMQGKKHGKGTYSYAKDGSKLVGDWLEGKIVRGEWIFPNGTFYSGKFRYNKPFGKGVWVFKNGNQLTGEYTQKEQTDPDQADPEDPEQPKPDPEVWCHFKHGRNVVVQGGSMLVPKE